MNMNINNLRPMRKIGQFIKDLFNPKVAIMRFELKAKNMDEKLNKMNAACIFLRKTNKRY